MSERRRALMGNQGELPSGYKRCKYLEGSQNTIIDVSEVQLSSAPHVICLCGSDTEVAAGSRSIFSIGSYTLNLCQIEISKNKISGYYSRSYSWNYNKTVDTSGYLNVYKIEDYKIYYNSSLVYTSNGISLPNIGFKLIKGTGVKVNSIEIDDSLYSFSGVSAVRLIDNKPGLYDTVSKTFFTNQGTGEFGYELMDGTYVAPV